MPSASICNLHGLLTRAARIHADRPAIRGGPTWDQRALLDAVERCAGGLRALGARTGDRIAVLADNRFELVVLHFAAARDGLVLVPCNVRLAAAELRQVLERATPRALLADRAWLESAAGLGDLAVTPLETLHETAGPAAHAPAATTADTPALLYFTSGTTGRPKGVVLTHGNVHAHALLAIAELRLRETDTWLHVAPMFHLADAWAIWTITAVGGCHAFVPRFDAAAVFDAIATSRATITNLVPTMLGRMVALDGEVARDTASMRLILSGGAPIAPETVRRVVEVFGPGCDYVQTYGMTETSPYLTMSLLDERQRTAPFDERLRIAARTGRPVLGVELRVVGADAVEVPADDASVGEIQVRGPSVTPGYWNDPDATAAAFTPDGFLRTGDLATVDASGSVRIVDRAKDVILTGGETVYSTEVENRLYEHPDVVEAAVHALPDADLGERVCAAVVLRPGAATTADALRAFCRAALAGYKTPKQIRFLAELPRTGSGKISKRALRDGAG
ncbi:MAG: AMP-binding protein [Planctomycetes bacterium]|nr:AMP-binding protein [Planctomycetota bacterium]